MTIPCAALVGALMQGITRIPGGAIIVFVLGVLIAVTAFAARSRQAKQATLQPTPVSA